VSGAENAWGGTGRERRCCSYGRWLPAAQPIDATRASVPTDLTGVPAGGYGLGLGAFEPGPAVGLPAPLEATLPRTPASAVGQANALRVAVIAKNEGAQRHLALSSPGWCRHLAPSGRAFLLPVPSRDAGRLRLLQRADGNDEHAAFRQPSVSSTLGMIPILKALEGACILIWALGLK